MFSVSLLMDVRKYGISRREIREGAGGGANEHFDELIGSTELYIYRHSHQKTKGYEALKLFLEAQGCYVVYAANAPNPVGQGYETISITNKGQEIPVPALKRAHSWAHQRNLLHLFRKRGR